MKAFLGRFKVDFFIFIFRNRVLFNMMSSSMTHSFWRSCDKLRPNLLFLYCSLITNITRIILRVLQFLGFTLIKNIKIKRPVGIFEVAIQHFFKFLNLFSFILKLSFQLLQGWRKGVILDLKVISGLLTLKKLNCVFFFLAVNFFTPQVGPFLPQNSCLFLERCDHCCLGTGFELCCLKLRW